jgi:peptidyl-prolyl cis-trans isomerase C
MFSIRAGFQKIWVGDFPILLAAAAVLVFLSLSACGGAPSAATAVEVQPTMTVTPLPVATTAVPTPTLTPEPLALRVNGESVLLAEFDAEFKQLQAAYQQLGKTIATEDEKNQVIENMIATVLLSQGAFEAGFQVDDAALQAEIDRMAAQMGGPQALSDWMAQQGYTDPVFRQVLRRQMAAAWQRDQIAGQVPETAEQIHARQILTTDEEIARTALEQVNLPGVNFAAQALRYDPVTGGDLGWFPRGYLLQPEVEEAAFGLQPGEVSQIIKSSIGYHIIQVISREPQRSISPDARRVLQHKALQEWVAGRRSNSQVEILVP